MNQKGTNGSVSVARMAALNLLPTVRAKGYKGGVSPEYMKRKDGEMRTDDIKNLTAMIGDYSSAKDGEISLLSPLFVEEMMGFPSGWTALPFLSENGETKP